MTAEIVIMNKEAVALAADSAITTIGKRGPKIFTSANKIFALSRHAPIGIMVYGTYSFMEVPWEIIIKNYRSKLKSKEFNTLKEYSDDFLDFLKQEKKLYPESVQKNHFKQYVYFYFFQIKKLIRKKIYQWIIKNKKIPTKEIEDIVSEIIKEHHKKLKGAKTIPNLPKNHKEQCKKKYGKIIEEAKKDIFEVLPITQSLSRLLIELALNLFSKIPEKIFPPDVSGIVIAGFGYNDMFPSLQSFLIEGVVNNVLQYRKHLENIIDFEKNIGTVVPFAQQEMVWAFMEGVNPDYEQEIERYFSLVCDEYPKIIIENINKIDNKEREELKEKLKKYSNYWKEQCKKRLKEYRREKYVNPVVRIVAMLSKDELAAMAGSLVSLTSFKKRVTIEAETVGGPIDVAIISKGDGFIWVKRKLYFKPELNPRFFEKYKKEVISDERGPKK